jgi:hypothetical protein
VGVCGAGVAGSTRTETLVDDESGLPGCWASLSSGPDETAAKTPSVCARALETLSAGTAVQKARMTSTRLRIPIPPKKGAHCSLSAN